MKDTIDPTLLRQLKRAAGDALIEALVIVADDAGAAGDTRGPAGPVIDRIAAGSGLSPVAVRFMPKLGVAWVKGSAAFLRCLLDQDEVLYASAKDAPAARRSSS